MIKYLHILFLFVTINCYSSHIVGGEIYYDYLGKTANKELYRVTLKIYRDCNLSTNPGFDGTGIITAWLTVIGGGRDTVIDIGAPVIRRVPPTINSRCAEVPDVCVEEGIYTYTLTLAPATGGYYLVYQSCCRNSTILNILQPGTEGATYYVWIPGPETASGNSSPRFKEFPPILLCNGLPFSFDHRATDPDGDLLTYSFTNPFDGTDPCCGHIKGTPAPSSAVCPAPPPVCPDRAPPPPYHSIYYLNPYTPFHPISSSPPVSISAQTGMIMIRPDLNGQFVVCVGAKEYRNGKLLNAHYRDFQFNIVNCVVTVISAMADQVQKCQGTAITFTNQSMSNVGNLTYKWDFGVPGTSGDTSNLEHPTYQYQDTGKYTVTLIGNPGKDCSDTIRKEIFVYPALDVQIAPNEKQCIKNNSFDFNAAGSFAQGTTFYWDFSARATPGFAISKNPSGIKFAEPGKHVVKLTGKYVSCVDSFIDTVELIRRPRAEILNPPFSNCLPATISFSSSSQSADPLSYHWKFSDNINSTEQEPVRVFSQPGIYSATLTIVSTGICNDTSTVAAHHFTVYPAPRASFSLSPEVTTILDPLITVVSTAGNGLSYEYDFGDGTSSYYHQADHVYFDYGNYTVTQYIIDANGCRDSARQIVQILPEHRFWVPGAFTPDENHLNDLFIPVVIGVTNYQFEVFDRWGRRLFLTNDPATGWNGSFNGEPCKQDVYIWRISYTDELNKATHQKRGHVTLIRSQL